MDDEDFGYTRRDDRVLDKVLTVGNERSNEAKTVRCDDENRGASFVSTNEGGGPSATPTTSDAANRPRGPSGTESTARSAPTSATAAATGSSAREPATTTNTSVASVQSDKPNIPNVVEYHLKVKTTSPRTHQFVDRTVREDRLEEMKKEAVSSVDKKKDLVSKLSRLSIDNNVFEGSTDLPQVFQVKYLGSHDARGLWGIKHTRKPVDNMVAAAKSLPTNTMLPLIKLAVSQDGVALLPLDKRKQESGSAARMYPIETISYGVQDLVYTRVFSMIVVRETENFRRVSPFECHGFVCESKHHARQLTHALATAFEIYSRAVKAQGKSNEAASDNSKKRFAIDLRSPEEIAADLCMDSEA